MTRSPRRWFVLSLSFAALLLVGAVPRAHALVGSGVLKGHSNLTVKPCGHDRGSFGAAVALSEDGTWTATNPEIAVGGTWAAIGSSGRKFALTFDLTSFKALFEPVAADVTQLCKVAVTPTSITKRRFTLTLDRRRKRATLAMEFLFKGTSSIGSGTAIYKLTGAGRWKVG